MVSSSDLETTTSYGDSAASGGRWGAIRTVSLQLLTTVTTIVLARILVPADFGAVAAALVIVGMFDLLTQAGIGTSLVRRDEVNTREASTIFWLACGVGILAALLAAGFSTPLAMLIGQPEAASLVGVLSWVIPLSLLRNVGRSLLQRLLRFRALALTEITSLLTYGVIAIVLALWGWGPWAIVVGYLVRGGVGAVLNFVAASWLPKLVFDRKFLRDELLFSSGVFGQQVMSYLSKNLDYWVVGAVLGATALGAYYIAFVIPDLIRRRLSTIAREVLYPILARIGVGNERARLAYLRIVRLVAFVSVPAMIGLAVVSDLAVDLAFGSQWQAAAGPMAVLSLASAVTSMSAPSIIVATAEGRPHIVLPAAGLGVAVLAIGLRITSTTHDLTTMAWSVVAAAVVSSVGLLLVTGRLMGLKLTAFLFELLPMLVATAIMAAGIGLIKAPVLSSLPTVGAAVTLVAVGVVIYFGVFGIFFRRALREQLKALRTILIPGRTRLANGPA